LGIGEDSVDVVVGHGRIVCAMTEQDDCTLTEETKDFQDS